MGTGLKIGDLEARIPVIQGGMGVGISLSRLAGTVAANGGIGIISTAQIGWREPDFYQNPFEANYRAMKKELEAARKIANDGIVGFNIMVATQRYEEYIKTRFMNYFHHYNLDSYGNGKTFGNPLKTINNLIQCVEVLQPILPQNATQQMKKKAESILENTTLALLNDYYNANILIKDLAGKPEFYEELKSKNEISKLINDMEKILNDMINDPQMTYNDLKPLFEYQKILNDGKKDNEKIQNAIKTRYEIVNRYIENLMIRKMATKPSIINGYMNYLNK